MECNDEVRQRFLDQIQGQFSTRLAAGRAEYGEVSTLAPIEEAFEESLDMCFYLWCKLQEEKGR